MDDAFRATLLASPALKLHQATALVDRATDRYLRGAHGISYSHFVVLLVIGILGQPTQRAVADNLDVSRASITQRVTALRERGLIRVTRDATDARSQRVSLTDKGEALLETAWRGLDAHDDGIEHGVDMQALERELDTLIHNARRYLGRPDSLPAQPEPGARE
jgi:DNA-binding MarR family transcriptional regulator